MMDIYVLDKNLDAIGIVDVYKSAIWANRYNLVGDCELYVPAIPENISMLQMGNYLVRPDDDMVCQIRKIQITTDIEEGNYLTVTGVDVKAFLDQRVVWSTITCDGNVESFIRTMVNGALGNPSLSARQLKKANGNRLFYLGDQAGFTEVTTEQISYKNIGEKVREYCKTYGWGYRVVSSDGALYFQLYKGTDRSDDVRFSDQYENLSSTSYTDDKTQLGNVALVAGEGEGTSRARNVYGYADGVDRFELYVDAKDVSKTITWADLTEMYPTTDQGGQGYISGSSTTGYTYNMNYINIQIVDSDQLANLQTTYPDGELITIDGNQYYQVYNEVIADLQTNSPTDDSSVILRNLVYSVYLLNRGKEKTAEYGEMVSFEGEVIPDVTFIYKQDYFLGDIVNVENEYGLSADARITEVIEVSDENGYSVQPNFEYMEVQ